MVISQAEFETAARAVLDELSVLLLRVSPKTLNALPGFAEELEAARSLLAQPDAPGPDILATSFGLVDEFISRNWQHVIAEAYQSYVSACAAQKQQ